MIFSHILTAYDGSASAKKALDKAIALMENGAGGKLTVLHVYNVQDYDMGEAMSSAPVPAEADTAVQDARAKVQHLNAEVNLIMGYPSHELLVFAENNGCDLIVVGSRGLSPIRDYVLGSVSHNVVQQAKVPVLVVK